MSEEQIKSVACPCCGSDNFQLPVKVSEAQLDSYLCSVLAGIPYVKSYPLYKGKIAVVAKQQVNADLLALHKAWTAVQYTVAHSTDNDYIQRMKDVYDRCVRLMPIKTVVDNLSQDKKTYDIQGVTSKVLKELTRPDITVQELDSLMQSMTSPVSISGVPQKTLDKIALIHQNSANLLAQSGFDQDFYQGIPQGS